MCPLGSTYPELSDESRELYNDGSSELNNDSQTPSQENYAEQCFVHWADVEKNIQRYQLVDIRSAQDYEDVHLNTSINIPPQQIKTKSFLKSQNVLIVAYGFEGGSLASLCAGLKHDGLEKVAILHGGIDSAVRSGVLTSGKVPHKLARYISPEQLVKEYFSDGLHVIVESEDLAVVLQDFDIDSTYLGADFGSKAWVGAARRLQMEHTPVGREKRPLIVVSKNGPENTASFANETDFWQVNVDVDELIEFLDRSEWTKLARHQRPGQFQCPAL